MIDTVLNSNIILVYTLTGRIGKVVASHTKGCRVNSRLRLHTLMLCMRHSGGTAHERGRGVTSQLDLSLMQLSIAGCGRLQLGVPHWVASVD